MGSRGQSRQLGLDNPSLRRVRHFSPLTGEWTVATHEYDASTGLRTGLVYNTGVTVDYTYDGFARLESVTHTDSGGLEFLTYEYERDDSGVIATRTQTRDDGENETVALWEYEHDAQRRMTRATLTEGAHETVIQYHYGGEDAPATELSRKTVAVNGGSPVTTTYALNAAGQLVAENDRTCEYDAWGQLLTVKDNGTTRQEMTWAADGTMTAATLYTAGGSFIKTVTFAYDEHGMRVGRGELGSGGEPMGEGTRWLRNWRNFTVHSDELVELGGDGEIAGDVAYGDGSRGSRLLAATRGGATPATESVHVDHMGSPGALTAADGVYIDNADIDYNPFGAATAESAAVDRHYTGQPWDADLGLQYHRYRWLNTTNARWTSPDPIFDFPNNFGSDYAYAGYSPAMMEDVSGLFSLGEVNVTAAIQTVLTQIVVPNLIGYVVRTVFVATGVDPMILVAPLFEKLGQYFGVEHYMARLFDQIKNGWARISANQLSSIVKEFAGLLTAIMIITEGVSAITSVVRFIVGRNLTNALDMAIQIAAFVVTLAESENTFEVEFNSVVQGRVVGDVRGEEWHHIIPRTGTVGEKGKLTRKFTRWFNNAPGLSINSRSDRRAHNVRKFQQFGNGNHSIHYYRLVDRVGSKHLRGKKKGTDEFAEALRRAIDELAETIEDHPYILDLNWDGNF